MDARPVPGPPRPGPPRPGPVPGAAPAAPAPSAAGSAAPRPAVEVPAVTAALAALEGVAERPLEEHVEVFDTVHRLLQDALAGLDER